MNGQQFLRLLPDSEITMEGKTYCVQQTNRRGQIQMVKLSYYVDVWEERDEHFDSEEEAGDHLSQRIEDIKQELTELAEFLSDLDDDDEEREETQNEIDEKQEKLENLEYADIESEETGTPFWMHYKDVNDEDITYSYEQD